MIRLAIPHFPHPKTRIDPPVAQRGTCFVRRALQPTVRTLRTLRTLRQGRRAAGMAIVEMLIAMGIMAFVLLSSITGLLNSNRQAAAYRAMTAARVIVERNIETALATTWNATTTPAILATTSTSGLVYDDDGGNDNQVNI